jgi:hypothetical protein
MKKIIPLLFIALSSFPVLLIGQDCTEYHQYHCLYADYTFFYSRQSKSSLFRPGQTSEMKIIAYSGEDYYVSVCAHRKFGNIHLRILEDNENKKVIYDNAQDNFSEFVTFSNEVTRNLILEVSVPLGDSKDTKEARCLGVVIQFRKTGTDSDSGK